MAIVDTGGYQFHMDGYLKANLDHVKKNVKKDYDAFILVTGREGFGKSTIADQIALYCDPTYNLSRCCFTSAQFQQACEDAEKYQAIVFDETMGFLSARGAMSKFNKDLIKIMSEMRSKNLFVILCIPNFFEMDKYPAIHRSTGLIHVYKRGSFMSYDYRKKKSLYLKGKKFYAYNVSGNFRGKFVKHFHLDKEKYEEKKQEAINTWSKVNDKERLLIKQRNVCIKWIREHGNLTNDEIGEIIGLTKSSITRITKEIEV